VVERLRKADEEEREGAVLADFVVVNDDFERAIAEIQAFIGAARDSRR
jgi:guanylate kinase